MSRGALSKWSPHRARASTRAEQALELRIMGHTFDQIAQACGFSDRSGAYRAIRRQLERTHGRVEELTTQLRRLDNARLERMLEALDAKVRKGDERAILVAERLLARRAKLLGLDLTPAQSKASTESPAELLGLAMRELDAEHEAGERVAKAQVISIETTSGNGKGNGKKKRRKGK